MASAGTVTVELDANSMRLFRELNKSTKRTKSWSRSTVREAKKAAAAFAVVGTAATAALTTLTKRSFDSIDSLAKVADKLGTTTEAMAGLRHAAEQTGVSTQTMEMAAQRLSRRVAEAAIGTGEAQQAIRQLGLSAGELAKLPVDQQLQQIAGAMEDVTTAGERVRLAMKLFDSEGVALVNTLALGADGLKAMQEEADQLGLSVSRLEAAKIEAANNALKKAQAAVTGIGNRIAVAVAPIVQVLAERFHHRRGGSGRLSRRAPFNALDKVARAVGFVANAWHGLQAVAMAVDVAFKAVAAGIAFVFSKIFGVVNVAIQTAADKIAWLLDQAARLPVIGDTFAAAATRVRGFAAGIAETNALLDSIAQTTKENMEASIDALKAKLAEPLPGDAIATWFDQLKAEAEVAAREIAARATAAAVGAEGGTVMGLPTPEAMQERVARLVEISANGALAAAERQKTIDDALKASLLANEQTLSANLIALAVEEARAKVAAKLEVEAAMREAAGLPGEDVDPLERQRLVAEEAMRIAEALAARRVKLKEDMAKKRDNARALVTTQHSEHAAVSLPGPGGSAAAVRTTQQGRCQSAARGRKGQGHSHDHHAHAGSRYACAV